VNDFEFGRLPGVSQIGIGVQDMSGAMGVYGAVFGVERWYRSKMASYEVRFKDEPTEIDWDIVVGYSGKIQVELIRVHRAGPNLYHEALGPDGSGFHHMGFVVRDFDRRLDGVRGEGIEVLQEGSIDFAGGAGCRFAYLDTIASLGFILEIIEIRVYGLQLGMPEWLLRVGTLTGDVELVG